MNPQSLDKLASDNPDADAAGLLALCSLDKRTLSAIPGDAYRIFLSINGKSERLKRTAGVIMQQNPDSTEAQIGVDRLLANVSYGFTGAPFDTSDPDLSEQMYTLANTMMALNGMSPTLGLTPTEVAELVALGGGYQVFDATLEDCEAAVVRAGYGTITALVNAEYMTSTGANNTLRNGRIDKLDTLKASGAVAPVDLASLDGGS